MAEQSRAPGAPRLVKEIKLRQYFVLGFGCIVGVGWVVVLGEWLRQAGPIGALLAFGAGGSLMIIVGYCYAEMATMFPVAGGEVAYTYLAFGTRPSFLTGWFISLNFIVFVSFEAISAGWILEVMVPKIKIATLYVNQGNPVNIGGLAFALGGTLCLTYLNYRGIKSAVIFQEIFTYALILLSLVFIVAGVAFGKLDNLVPPFSTTEAWPLAKGLAAVFIMAPIFICGFNVIPQAMEEKDERTPLRLVGKVIVISITGALIFYLLVILSSSMSVPWQSIIGMDMPVASVFEAAFHSKVWAQIILLAALCGIVTSWNTVFISASRALFALGRARIIPPGMGTIHRRHGTPSVSILFVGILALLGVFLGRSAIVPILNVGVACMTFVYVLVCWGVIRLRRLRPDQPRPYRVPGGVPLAVLGTVVSVFVFFLSIVQPYLSSKGKFPLEWMILIGWSILGVFFWFGARKIRNQVSEEQREKLILGR